MIDPKKVKAGDDVVVMKDNKPTTVKVHSVDRLDRWKNNIREEHVHIFVEGIERRVEPEELFESADDCVKSLLPEATKQTKTS